LKFKRRLVEDDEAVPMASMADIAFLLIIFFMLTTVFAVDSGLIIELPETEVRERVDLREIVFTITPDGEIHAEGMVVAMTDIGSYITTKRRANPSRPVVVRSDRNVPYGRIADLMDELLTAGVRDVALPTAPQTDGK
jgi:biopolymer transport protein ExbD